MEGSKSSLSYHKAKKEPFDLENKNGLPPIMSTSHQQPFNSFRGSDSQANSV